MSTTNQRTKGNVKPSNSERAARLLSSNAFLSFSQASQTLSDVYTAKASTEDTSSFKYGLSSDFQGIFKHMTKKDINTKLKALQDFVVLCSSKGTDELLQTAPFWYRIYRKLSNVIDWRVRQEVHNAHVQFISKFDRETIVSDIQNVSSANVEADSETTATSEVSFQNMITMPATMWTSCFDVYSQSADSAKKAFSFLYPTERDRIDFILANYESILNYCTYCVFEKIPIKLFYSTPLPPDSIKVFEEHLLVTSLRGLSSLVNELISFYLEAENGPDDALASQVFQCLEQVLLRLNTEFGKSKFAHINSAKATSAKPTPTPEAEVTDGATGEAFLSKKDKKKLRKEEKDKENAKKEAGKGGKAHCKFWNYYSVDSISVRVSFFHALNSITRLTSLMFDSRHLKDSSIYEQLNASNQLWFKLYKGNFYENVFKSFVDSVSEIRGLAWLLGTHVLTYPTLYKPWSVVNHDKWLKETLVAFISNGMRAVGGTIDFGLFNIGLEKCQRLYPEFFSKKYSHLSGLQLTCNNYAELDILANVKLVIIFADAFNCQQEDECSLKIFETLLFALNDAFTRVVLQSDMDFLIEIYFNLIYHLVRKCLQLPIKSRVEALSAGVNLVEEMKLNALFRELFQTHLHNILVRSLDANTSDHLFNSQIYLNLLLLVSNTAEYYKDLSLKESDYDVKTLLQLYNLFKFNVQTLYSGIFAIINADLQYLIDGKAQQVTFQLNRALRFLNDSVLFQFDGYFSSEFYYARGNTNYDKNALKLLRSSFNKESNAVATGPKRVNFGGVTADDDDNETAVTLVAARKSISKNWWIACQNESMFSFSMANSAYSQRSAPRSTISLLTEHGALSEEVTAIAIKLIQLLDRRMTFGEQTSKTANEDLFVVILHVQYILRFFNSQQLTEIFTQLQGTPANDGFSSFIGNYLLKWIDCIYGSVSKRDAHQPMCSLRFQVALCRKVFDILLVCLSTQEETTRAAQMKNLCLNSNPFTFCVLFHHLDNMAALPVSPKFTPTIAQFRGRLVDSLDIMDTLLRTQIDILFKSGLQCKSLDCDILINLIMFFTSQGELAYERTVEQKELQMSKMGAVLSLLHQRLNQNTNSQAAIISSEFPLLCREIYQLLFSNAHLLSRIDNFEETLVNLTKLFFRQMFDSTANSSAENTDVKLLSDNSAAFWTLSLEKLFDTLPKYKTSLQLVVQDLLAITIDGVILDGERWNSSNYQLIINEVVQFLETLFTGYKGVFTQHDSIEEIHEIRKQFSSFLAQFSQKISEKVQVFLKDNIFAYFYELERNSSSSLHKLSSIYELFQSSENVVILESLNDADQFNDVLNQKLASFESSLYLSNCQASIVNFLLSSVYLDPLYKKHLNFDLASQLAASPSSPFELLQTVRSLTVNLYHLDRFLKLYYPHGSDTVKYEQLRNIYSALWKQIDSILRLLLKSSAKKGEGNSLTIQLIHFLISNDDLKDISSLPHANFVLSNFYPTTNWMEVLNHIGLPAKLERPKVSKMTLLYLANTENIGKVNEILTQALRYFESAAISESYSEPKTQTDGEVAEEKKETPTLFDWSKLSTEEVNQVLFIITLAFNKLATIQSTTTTTSDEKNGEEAELKEKLLNFLTLLYWSKLEKLYDPNIPAFSSAKYLTFLLSSQLFIDALPCLEGSTRPVHFSMFLTVLKLWVQILYTSLPESIEKESPQELRILLMASRMLETLNVFGDRALTMSKEDDSLLEVIEMWRNFVAFDSFNMLLPLFIVLNNSPKRNLVEKAYLKRLVQTIDYVDTECLQDISTLELNQYLLMYPDEKSTQRALETQLNRFIENAHLEPEETTTPPGTSKGGRRKVQTATLALSPSNAYFDYLLNYATPLLLHSDFNWSFSAFQVVSIMFQDLPWAQKAVDKAYRRNRDDSDDSLSLNALDNSMLNEKVMQLGPPESFRLLLEKLDKVTEYILLDCEFGVSVEIDPNSDVYNYIFAYLLVWLLYLHLVDPFPMSESSESRSDLIAYLAERGLHTRLFDNLFHLMHSLEEEEDTEESNVDFLRRIKNLKDIQNLRHLIGERDGSSLSKLAFCVYYHVLANLPHLMRSWFSNLKPVQKRIVDDFTVHNFSAVLIEKELDRLRAADREKFGNIVVTTSKKANEITAVYSLREISFGIKFTFNDNFPLTTVRIECFNRSGVSEDRCRKWIQRLTIFFNKQNCSIMDGIVLLRPNMDKFFEGIEECMICLFVLYGATSDLPRFKCPQCRKKFHFACIRKWFQTNDNRSCPQCKYDFN